MIVSRETDESRDSTYLTEELRKRWELSRAEYLATYPDEPTPFLTQTYRSPKKQNELYEQGRTKPGNIVTWVRGGNSYHNQFPSLAFDIAFNILAEDGGPYVREDLFGLFASIAKTYDLAWGGDWAPANRDMPHFQVPRYSLSDYYSNKTIPWKEIPNKTGPIIVGDINFDRVFVVHGEDIMELELSKMNLVGTKLYLKLKGKE